ncbi:sulfatase-like hydrolase/transferase [Rhodocyclaceae bacterium]
MLSWFWLILHVSLFTTSAQYAGPGVALWTLATTLSYAFLYLLPALLVGHLLRWLLARTVFRNAPRILAVTSVVLTGLVHVLLFADRVIFGMYGFHINGFVIDLVTTPGGIDSLGANLSTQITATLIILALLALQAGSYFWMVIKSDLHWPGWLRLRWLLPALLALTLSERFAYGYSAATHYQPILFASERYPLYLPLTFRKLAAKMGIDRVPAQEGIRIENQALHYPLKPLQTTPPAKAPNIVWLVAESLRFDMLDQRIMPRLWDFSEQAIRMETHYSGGNLTQMGVFSMFYGLYGNYWFPMYAARRTPVLMDVLQQQNYQFGLYTSQRFTFPAFDKTIFAGMNPADMHARSGGAPAWQRDVTNIDEMLDFIDRRDPQRPFMSYMFFESTHASYDFPPEAAIAKPYLEDFNYLTTDLSGHIGEIKNRYINAAHHIDSQIARVIAHLRQNQLLDNTIVIVLGDHGEEFMEISRWGHSAEFNRFQTSTPAVLWVPGQAPRVMRGITSHLDIPATLLPLLGVRNPPEDYSMGKNLLAADFHRDYAVAADWNRIAYLGTNYKVAFPVNATGAAIRDEVTDNEDHPVADPAAVKTSIRAAMLEMMRNLTRFSQSKRG